MASPRLRKLTLPQSLLLLSLAWMALSVANAQQTTRPKKVLTPEQLQFQAQNKQWMAQRKTLRDAANVALNAEFARERAGDCPNASTTRGAEICLSAEIVTTEKNYADFTKSLRAMLALTPPTMPGQPPLSGPTGTPPTAAQRVAEFDEIATRSKDYRALCAIAAYNQFKGGTEAPVFALEAQQYLLRIHLHELAFIYAEELSNH